MHGFWAGGMDAYLNAIRDVHRDAERRLRRAMACASSDDEKQAIEAELLRSKSELDRRAKQAQYGLF